MTPPVSVLMPFRNAAATLGDCIDSILGQSLVEFELLAINDHSDDGSVALVADYARRDARLRLLHSPQPGIVAALNFGLEQADAELVARMDADDIMFAERLQRQLAGFGADPALDLLGCATRLFPDSQIQAGYREYLRWQNGCNTPEQIAREIYLESPFAHPSVMFRRSRVLALGGYRQGTFPEDYDLWLRMHQAGCRMAKLPETLLHWRDYPGRTSRVDPRCSREAFDRLRADYLVRDPRFLARQNTFVIWGAGRKTRLRTRHLQAHGFQPQAWVDIDPRKIGNRLKGVPVVEPRWLAQQPCRPLVLVYVANHGARSLIARELDGMGYRHGEDYLAVG